MNVLSITLPKILMMSNRFEEGGYFFMTAILLCLLLSIGFTIKGVLNRKTNAKQTKKMLSLATDSGLLGLALGFLGSIIGLIDAFDFVQSIGSVDPVMFSGGLKVCLLTATFGLFTFVISRLSVLILRGVIPQ